jgi:hypothetical protein
LNETVACFDDLCLNILTVRREAVKGFGCIITCIAMHMLALALGTAADEEAEHPL